MYVPAPHPTRLGLFVPVRIDPTGASGPTRHQASRPGFRRTSQGLYLPSEIPAEPPQQRILEAWTAVSRARGVAAITGWAALCWLGARWFDGTADADGGLREVDVVATTRLRTQPGYVVHHGRVDLATLLEHDGVIITDPWTSVCFEARRAADLRAAVVAVDMGAYDDLASISELRAEVRRQAGLPGIEQLITALRLADENSGSPQEPRLRLAWTLDAGLPPPLCNRPLFTRDGHHLATPDLFDPVAGVVGEYDGAVHLGQRKRDRDREERLRAAGLEYFTMLAGDLGKQDAVDRMRAARSRGRFVPREHCAWTLEQPHWWTPTETVAQRRALSEERRSQLLGLRVAS